MALIEASQFCWFILATVKERLSSLEGVVVVLAVGVTVLAVLLRLLCLVHGVTRLSCPLAGSSSAESRWRRHATRCGTALIGVSTILGVTAVLVVSQAPGTINLRSTGVLGECKLGRSKGSRNGQVVVGGMWGRHLSSRRER